MVGNAPIINAAKLNAETNTEKLLLLLEKFIKCLVDYALFVRIPIVELGLPPGNPLPKADGRGLLGLRTTHRFSAPHELFERLFGQFALHSLAHFRVPANLPP